MRAKIVLLGSYASNNLHRLHRHLRADCEVATVRDEASSEATRRIAEAADIIITHRLSRSLGPLPRLAFLQVPAAGCDLIDFAVLPAGCIVANVFEHEGPIAEYVVAALLEWRVRIGPTDRDFRSGSWRASHAVFGPPRGEVAGSTVGLIGIGHIGQAVARRLQGFGVRVVGHARSRAAPPEGIEARLDLDELLSVSDFVVVACPLTAQTRGMINAAALRRMLPSAVLVNVGRAEIVDEEALFDALAARRIGGAVIDVWYRYPTPDQPAPQPSRFPFAALDNVVMTPHCSGWTEGTLDRRWRIIAANVERFLAGEDVLNRVSPP